MHREGTVRVTLPWNRQNGCNIVNAVDDKGTTTSCFCTRKHGDATAGRLEASKVLAAAANGTSPANEGEILSSFRGKTVDFPRTRNYFSRAHSSPRLLSPFRFRIDNSDGEGGFNRGGRSDYSVRVDLLKNYIYLDIFFHFLDTDSENICRSLLEEIIDSMNLLYYLNSGYSNISTPISFYFLKVDSENLQVYIFMCLL